MKVNNLLDKLILALRSLNAAISIDPEHPGVHEQSVAFRLAVKKTSDAPPKVLEVIKANFKRIEESQDLKSFNEDFAKKHSDSPAHRLSAIRVKKLLGEDKVAVEQEVHDLLSLPGADSDDAIKGLETLRNWRSGEVNAYKKAAQEKWPGVTRLL
jgi:N-alpha-acetyltransferase 15/16, NatA auxiliary subunit